MEPVPQDLDGLAGIIALDATVDGYPITYVSPGFELLTGYGAGEVLGRNPRLLQGPDTDPRAVGALRDATAAGRAAYVTLLNYRADGTPFWNEVAIAPEHDTTGRIVRWLGAQRDVTDRMRLHARLHELAYYDTLTGLANRAALHDELRSSLHRARVHDREVALLQVDLDDFQRVNEQHGHQVGDVVLRAVGERLRATLRPHDLIARTGSDEFALLLDDLPGNAAEVANDLAARVVQALHEPHGTDALKLEVHASVGIATFPAGAKTATELVDHAGAAVDVAKRAGKDRVHLHAPIEVLTADAAFSPGAYAGELRRILDGRLLRAVYQPIVRLAGGEIVGYEALARGPEGSPLHHPERLFATAAAAGRTVELDWACRAVAVEGALTMGLGRGVALSLNVAPAAVGAPCPPRHATIWERGTRELTLVLDLGEEALLSAPAEHARHAVAHRRAGRAIAIDDVGGRRRALTLPALLDPDVLKLDLGRLGDPATRAAFADVAALQCERRGTTILAERIETAQDLETALALGATLGQGFALGRPGPLAPGGHATAPALRVEPPAAPAGTTPFEVLAASRPLTEGSEERLVAMGRRLEQAAAAVGDGVVLLCAWRHARHLTVERTERYRTIARGAGLLAVLGVGIDGDPAPGIRGVALGDADPLAGEYALIVLGPHYAAALAARDVGEGRVEVASTHERELTLAAARTLMVRMAPDDRGTPAVS